MRCNHELLGDDDEGDLENGQVSKRRRTATNLSMRKSSNRYMINVLQIFSCFWFVMGHCRALIEFYFLFLWQSFCFCLFCCAETMLDIGFS
jgi:hypothetical protein